MNAFDWEYFSTKERLNAVSPQDAVDAHKAVDEAFIRSFKTQPGGHQREAHKACEGNVWLSGTEAAQPSGDRA